MKPIANFVIETAIGRSSGSFMSYIQRNPVSIARIEGLSAFEVTSHVLLAESPGQLQGKTYTADVFYNALPFGSAPDGYKAINVEYSERLNRDSVGRFGFSPVAEAYLNFGWWGIAAIGAIAGIFVGIFNRFAPPLLYVVLLEASFRFYRTDFASLFKRYMVVELIFTVLAILIVVMLARKRPQNA